MLHAAVQEAAQNPKVKERVDSAGFLPVFSSPEDFSKSYAQAAPVWQQLIQVAEAKVD